MATLIHVFFNDPRYFEQVFNSNVVSEQIINVHTVIFPDWVGEIHTAQSQRLDWRQRTRISNILS